MTTKAEWEDPFGKLNQLLGLSDISTEQTILEHILKEQAAKEEEEKKSIIAGIITRGGEGR